MLINGNMIDREYRRLGHLSFDKIVARSISFELNFKCEFVIAWRTVWKDTIAEAQACMNEAFALRAFLDGSFSPALTLATRHHRVIDRPESGRVARIVQNKAVLFIARCDSSQPPANLAQIEPRRIIRTGATP